MTESVVPSAITAPLTPVEHRSNLHVFSIQDILGAFDGQTYAENPDLIDTDGSSGVAPYTDKDGNILYPVDSEFGFHVADFLGAEAKTLDGDYGEGFAGDIFDDEGNVIGLAVRNAETDLFKSGAPFGTWSLGLGGATVKASTEHYNVMAHVLSDQEYPGDPNAIAPLDNDLKLMDMRPTGVDGALEPGLKHDLYIKELVTALERAIADNDGGLTPQTYADLDFDRDGSPDAFDTLSVDVQADLDGDGVAETIQVGGVDLDQDGTADIVDSWLNGFGTADIVDLLEPNEATTTFNIAYGADYSVTLKDDGKLLYRWGEAVKKPNDLRMDVALDLPDEWTRDDDGNGIADSLEAGHSGFTVTRAELVITHTATNNPNDQIRPEDYENEAAIGRLPSYYVITDPDDSTNTLWVSVVDSYDGEGVFLPSYLKLNAAGEVDLTASGTPVFDPDGALVGYRNEDASGFIGTVYRSLSLAENNIAADLDAYTSDQLNGFTNEYYTTVDREPFEWSYDVFPDDPYKQVFESFRNPEEAAAAGFTEDQLVSGPRWRLTPNKFGQDLPGLEVPLEENTPPPYQRDNIKYETGELATTVINLLDWNGESPLANSQGWMLVDHDRLDANGDGLIDEGWSAVNGTLGAGEAMPTGPIFAAVSPNGQELRADSFDTAVYVKGDRQDSANLFDMQLIIEYETDNPPVTIGAVQKVNNLTHEAKTVSFQDGASFLNPVVFASPASRGGSQPVTTEFSEITSTGATLYLEEPDYLEGTHMPESVTLLTLEEGVWRLTDGSLLQVGTTVIPDSDTNTFYSVSFEQAFEEAPIIVLQVQTNNGPQWEIARADNITTTGFDIALQEQEASDGFHISEVVGWAAFDAADSDVFEWNGIGVQAFDTGAVVTRNSDPFEFAADVGLNPLISASISSFNGSDPAVLRLQELTHDGTNAAAQFMAQEEKSLDEETVHNPENVTGFAFESAGLLTGTEVFSNSLLLS